VLGLSEREETRECVIAWLTVAPGTRDEFLKVASPCAAAFRQAEGCLFFGANPSTDDPDGVTFTECFSSAEAHSAHNGAPRVQAFWKELERFGRHLRFETIFAGRVEPGSFRFDGSKVAPPGH